MKTRLVITDLTRMYHQNVCIAGYANNHECIRPVSDRGSIPQTALYLNGKAILYPLNESQIKLNVTLKMLIFIRVSKFQLLFSGFRNSEKHCPYFPSYRHSG